MRPDWANLPAEMVTPISEKTYTNKMYVHLCAVCKAWRKALTPHPRHLPGQVPWLLLPGLGVDYFHLCFYDLSRSKIHRFELPYLSGKCIYGSSYGWLVLKHDYRVSLLNPITRRSIDLPPLDAIFNTKWSLPSPDRYKHYTQKVMLSCSPSDSDCIAVACSPPWSDWELVFCRIGDTYWTGLKKRPRLNANARLLDFSCHNNSVYTVISDKKVSLYDLQTLAVWTYPSKIKYNITKDCINLVEGDVESGGPLVVNSPKHLEGIN